MEDWLVNLPVLWMGALILGVVYLVTAGIYLVVTRLAVGDTGRAFKAISPGILPPLSLLFGLIPGRAGLERERAGGYRGQPGGERLARLRTPRHRVSG